MLKQIRKKVENVVTIDDYVQNIAECYLMELHTRYRVVADNKNDLDIITSNIISTSPTKVMLTIKDNKVLSVVNKLTNKYRRPMRRNWLQEF